MDLKQNISKIKKHFYDNHKEYLIGAGCLAAGLAIGVVTILLMSKNSEYGVKTIQKINQFGFHNDVTPMIVNFVERSTPSKPVHLVGTSLFFNSLHEAAKETGHSLRDISKNVNGLIPDVDGDVFELLKHA